MKPAFVTGLFLVLASSVVTHALASNQTNTPIYPTAPQEDVRAAAVDNNAFATDLYARLDHGPGNLLFSPYSISSALAMTYAGARNQTAIQMARTLHFSLPDERLHRAFGALSGELTGEKSTDVKSLYQLSVADALWTQKGLSYNPDFIHLLKQDYAAELHESDFAHAFEQARTDINQWVAQKTANKIPNLLPAGALNPGIRLVLVNAIYFKGNWAFQFPKNQTSDQPFHLNGHENVSAPLMFQSLHCPSMEDAQVQIIELPYFGDELSMVILLPRTVDGLPALEQKLTPQFIDQSIAQLVSRPVNVHLPKFKLACQFELADVLAAMGMSDAFSNSAADFSGMTTSDRFHISTVIHEAVMDVNEEGTEAAAATAVGMKALAIVARPPPPIEFRADHPFIFLIRQQSTGAILFAGRVVNPK
jgi:serpin B